MLATSGGIDWETIKYELPYAQGLQIIWAEKVSHGDAIIKALHPDKMSATESVRKKFKELLG